MINNDKSKKEQLAIDIRFKFISWIYGAFFSIIGLAGLYLFGYWDDKFFIAVLLYYFFYLAAFFLGLILSSAIFRKVEFDLIGYVSGSVITFLIICLIILMF